MKDPLQPEPSPYEILEVPREVTAADVDRAFKAALGKRRDVRQLMRAKQLLEDPSKRALVDAFLYQPTAVSQLEPNPLADPAALEPPRRADTAAAWTQRLRREFPSVEAVHSLGVLWYWWAMREDAQRLTSLSGTAAASPSEPAADDAHVERWQRVIAHWVALAANDEFWNGRLGVPAELVEATRQRLVEDLRNTLHDLSHRYRGAGASALAERYQALELLLTTELETATALARENLRTSRGRVICGPLMLRQLDLLQQICGQLEQAAAREPSNARWSQLRESLSPYAPIAVLIRTNKPQEALRAAARLPKAEQDAVEVRRLRLQAKLALGKQQESLQRFDDALVTWRGAIQEIRQRPLAPICARCGHESGQRLDEGRYWCTLCSLEVRVAAAGATGQAARGEEERLCGLMRACIVKLCQDRAKVLLAHDRASAITWLERGLQDDAADAVLKSTLAELLRLKGVERIVRARQTAERDKRVSPEVEQGFQDGLAAIDRAVSLGSDPARRDAEQVRQLLVSLREAFVELPPAAVALIKDAEAAASTNDWDKAVALLSRAVRHLQGRAEEVVNKKLANAIANLAIKRANAAMEGLNSVGQHRAQMMARLQGRAGPMGADQFPSQLGGGCGHCGAPVRRAEGWATLTTDSGPVLLCPSCVELVKASDAQIQRTRERTIEHLRASHGELAQAAALDPSSDYARKNLHEISKLLKQFGVTVSSSRPSSSTRKAASSKTGPSGPARAARQPANSSASRAAPAGAHRGFVGSLLRLVGRFWWLALVASIIAREWR